MKLLQINDSPMAPIATEPTLQLSMEGYLAHSQIQPLSELMIEIIIFQLREQALFADVEISAYCLN